MPFVASTQTFVPLSPAQIELPPVLSFLESDAATNPIYSVTLDVQPLSYSSIESSALTKVVIGLHHSPDRHSREWPLD